MKSIVPCLIRGPTIISSFIADWSKFHFVTELLGDLLKKKPKETDGIDSVIVVDNIPQVGPQRLEKLQKVIQKIFSKFGKIINELYPKKENGDTKG